MAPIIFGLVFGLVVGGGLALLQHRDVTRRMRRGAPVMVALSPRARSLRGRP